MEKSLRDKVDGIMVLKLRFTASDLELFPRLKVLVNEPKQPPSAFHSRNVLLSGMISNTVTDNVFPADSSEWALAMTV